MVPDPLPNQQWPIFFSLALLGNTHCGIHRKDTGQLKPSAKGLFAASCEVGGLLPSIVLSGAGLGLWSADLARFKPTTYPKDSRFKLTTYPKDLPNPPDHCGAQSCMVLLLAPSQAKSQESHLGPYFTEVGVPVLQGKKKASLQAGWNLKTPSGPSAMEGCQPKKCWWGGEGTGELRKTHTCSIETSSPASQV